MPLPTVATKCIYNYRARSRVRWLTRAAELGGYSVLYLCLMAYLGNPISFAVFLFVASIALMTWHFASRARLRATAAQTEPMRTTLQERYSSDFSGAEYVGVSPHRWPAQYQGDEAWDVGFVKVGDTLDFRGDQCCFELTKQQISACKLVHLFFLPPRLYIRYWWPGWAGERWINFAARNAGSVTDQYVILQRLRTQIVTMPDRALAAPTANAQGEVLGSQPPSGVPGVAAVRR